LLPLASALLSVAAAYQQNGSSSIPASLHPQDSQLPNHNKKLRIRSLAHMCTCIYSMPHCVPCLFSPVIIAVSLDYCYYWWCWGFCRNVMS